MRIKVMAHPRAKRPRLEEKADILHVYISQPAADDKANLAIISALAKYYRVGKTKVLLLKGQRSKIKVFEIVV